MTRLSHTSILLVLGLILAGLLALTLAPYGFHPSALIHLGREVAAQAPLPPSFIVLEVPSYDGAMYYRIAEKIPSLFDPSRWEELRDVSPGAYAYQRMLLPILAWMLAAGNDAWLSWSFLAINVLCLLGSAWMLSRAFGMALPSLAIALSPSALIGLHFSTAEPLNILLLSALLLHFRKKGKFDALGSLLLCLLLITREINLPLAVMMLGWFLWNRRWKEALFTLPGIALFCLWQATLHAIFGSIPFLVNQTNTALPLVAPLRILTGAIGYDRFSLSSIALFLGFVVPGLVLMGQRAAKEKTRLALIPALFFGYLLLMAMMPMHIWGSITSIGRAITPVYPLATLVSADAPRGKWLLMILITLGIGAAIGLGLSFHPFRIVG